MSVESSPLAAPMPHNLGGHSGGETPLPIPNREVKPASADGTRRAISRESRTPPIFFATGSGDGARRRWPVAAQAARSFSRQSGSSVAQPPDALADRRMRDEERREALLGERVRRVERLGRRARLERDELHRPARAGAARRRGRAASRRARPRSGRPRTRASARAGGARTTRRAGRARTSSARWSQPPIRDDSTTAAATIDRDRLDEHVAVPQMRELVRDDPLELGRRRDAEQPGRDRERRAAAARRGRPRARAGSRPASR